MYANMIRHNIPTLGKEEEEATLRVIRSGWISQGKEVESFETEFCKFLGLSQGHAVAVSNGTSALFLSLWALGAENKKIHFPVYVCSAIRNAIGMADGIEFPIDISDNSPNFNPSKDTQKKNSIKIIPHMYGIPIDLSEQDSKNTVEDCAQAIGAKIGDKYVGLQGEIGIFSFYASKLMTSGGQGGMIVSKNLELIEKIKDYREYDFRKDEKKRFNFQMTDLQAAVGRAQLKKLPEFLEKREKIFQNYKKSGLDLLDIPEENYSRIHPVRYRAVLRTKNAKKLIEYLHSEGIESKIPTEDWELLGDPKLFPNALDMSKNTVSIPIYPSLKDDEVSKIISCTKSFFDKMN